MLQKLWTFTRLNDKKNQPNQIYRQLSQLKLVILNLLYLSFIIITCRKIISLE